MMLKSGRDEIPSLAYQALEVLVFTLDEKEYAIDLKKVQELRSYDTVIRPRHSPDIIRGVIDLLGNAVPILDMRVALKLGMLSSERFTDIVIVHIDGQIVGLMVDTIVDVVALTMDQIRLHSALNTVQNPSALIGIGLVDNRMLTLIDIDMVMSDSEMEKVVDLTR